MPASDIDAEDVLRFIPGRAYAIYHTSGRFYATRIFAPTRCSSSMVW